MDSQIVSLVRCPLSIRRVLRKVDMTQVELNLNLTLFQRENTARVCFASKQTHGTRIPRIHDIHLWSKPPVDVGDLDKRYSLHGSVQLERLIAELRKVTADRIAL